MLGSGIIMRRVVASLVLSLMAWTFAAPIALALTGKDTPACCRRNGKHQCLSGKSGMVSPSTDDLPVFRAKSSNCPHQSQIATPTGVAQKQSSSVSVLELPRTVLILTVDSPFFDSRLVSSSSERGPPPFWV